MFRDTLSRSGLFLRSKATAPLRDADDLATDVYGAVGQRIRVAAAILPLVVMENTLQNADGRVADLLEYDVTRDGVNVDVLALIGLQDAL